MHRLFSGRRRAAPGRALALTLCLALATGCGDDEPEARAPGDPPASSDTAASPTDVTSPTASAPTVDPATGPPLRLDDVELRLPEQWSVEHDLVGYEKAGSADDHTAAILLSSFPALDPDATVAQLARSTERTSGYPRGSVQEPTTVAGLPAFHVAGRVAGTFSEEFGVLHEGNIIGIEFVHRRGSRAHWQELIDSVLATVELR